ncbi:MAG: hypothetical protein KAX49_07905 [Halanaerobiales bacterium]|nr:hypothetical protein [Halanaerobiales bacterium]
MANIIFFSFPFYGHINYALKIAAALQKTGHQVYFLTTNKYKKLVEDRKVNYIECCYDRMIAEDKIEYKGGLHDLYALADAVLRCTSMYLNEDLERIKALNPDCIVYDSYAYWGREVALRLGVPYISSVTNYAFNMEAFKHDPISILKDIVRGEVSSQSEEDYSMILRMLELFSKKLSVKYLKGRDYHIMETFCSRGVANIVYSYRDIHIFSDFFDNSYHFLGPIIEPAEEDCSLEFSSDSPNLYISLGTILDQREGFFNQCIDAFKDKPYTVYLSIGQTDISKLHSIPPNFVVKNTLPQIAILKHASLFITHGSPNSTNESLYYGVPMIIIPQATDGFINGENLEKIGVGVSLDYSFTSSKKLREISDKILSDKQINSRTSELSKIFKSLGGCQKAVDAICGYLKEKR